MSMKLDHHSSTKPAHSSHKIGPKVEKNKNKKQNKNSNAKKRDELTFDMSDARIELT